VGEISIVACCSALAFGGSFVIHDFATRNDIAPAHFCLTRGEKGAASDAAPAKVRPNCRKLRADLLALHLLILRA